MRQERADGGPFIPGLAQRLAREWLAIEPIRAASHSVQKGTQASFDLPPVVVPVVKWL